MNTQVSNTSFVSSHPWIEETLVLWNGRGYLTRNVVRSESGVQGELCAVSSDGTHKTASCWESSHVARVCMCYCIRQHVHTRRES